MRSTGRAHPRSRGENIIAMMVSRRPLGSSPLTRGKLNVLQAEGHALGLIPAHAGKTTAPPAWGGRGPAHPRSRGENERPWQLEELDNGSSPLTRGKLEPHQLEGPGGRLIPAHAGKTTRRGCRNSDPGAHPRSRGENRSGRSSRPSAPGSSPLTRGKRKPIRRAARGRGLIPAHAGKTPLTCPEDRRSRAHPRSRGENTS